VGLVALLLAGAAFIPEVQAQERGDFVDAVIDHNFEPHATSGATLGLEVELSGLKAEQLAPILVGELGGRHAGTFTRKGQTGHRIEGTRVGDILIVPEGSWSTLRRWIDRTTTRRRWIGFVRPLVDALDRRWGALEIVTEPMSYDQTRQFARAMDAVGLAGAKGTGPTRLLSTQVNVGIDAERGPTLKRLLANYVRNQRSIRKSLTPSLLRRRYVEAVHPRFEERLLDPAWEPDAAELFSWYRKYSPHKSARLNLYNALLMSPANVAQARNAGDVPRDPRPAAEFREADTVMSTANDATRASRHIMRQARFGMAMVAAAESDGVLAADGTVEARGIAVSPPARKRGFLGLPSVHRGTRRPHRPRESVVRPARLSPPRSPRHR
jgi:hypothetical protein